MTESIMRGKQFHQRGAARAQVAQKPDASWLLAMLTAIGVVTFGMSLAHSQSSVPEVVRPRTDSPTLPPTGGDGSTTARPRSENPLVDGGGARPVPDNGVIAPVPAAPGSTPVIRPPAVGTMPVIPPPGTPGGDRSVVPK